jgi:hypothetical protein
LISNVNSNWRLNPSHEFRFSIKKCKITRFWTRVVIWTALIITAVLIWDIYHPYKSDIKYEEGSIEQMLADGIIDNEIAWRMEQAKQIEGMLEING